MLSDLNAIEVVDNHCHALQTDQGNLDLASWRRLFTEGDGPRTTTYHVRQTAAYHRILNDLAEWLDTSPDEATVFEARQAADAHFLSKQLLERAGIKHLLIDDGYPPPPVLTLDEHSELISGSAYQIVRIEPLAERLIETTSEIDDLASEIQTCLRSAADDGAVGFKSAIAYRSGLSIRKWSTSQAQDALEATRSVGSKTGSYRLENAQLHDTIIHACLEVASERRLPVQFHVGYGDRDIDMRAARPENLRPLFEDDSYSDVPIVLLHQCYPFTAVGAWLASVYDNVWLDLSYAIPLLSAAEMLSFTRQALAVAPWSKLLYSSDGLKIPEFHWSAAIHGRQVIFRALSELVEGGDLSTGAVEQVAQLILSDNATQLYRLE